MKAIINENRLNKVIERYLEQQLGDLIEVDELYGGGNYYVKIGEFLSPDKDERPQAILVAELDGDRLVLALDKHLHQKIISMFSMEGFDSLDKPLKNLMKTKYDMSVNDVVTY
jgi:hypothetical protein